MGCVGALRERKNRQAQGFEDPANQTRVLLDPPRTSEAGEGMGAMSTRTSRPLSFHRDGPPPQRFPTFSDKPPHQRTSQVDQSSGLPFAIPMVPTLMRQLSTVMEERGPSSLGVYASVAAPSIQTRSSGVFGEEDREKEQAENTASMPRPVSPPSPASATGPGNFAAARKPASDERAKILSGPSEDKGAPKLTQAALGQSRSPGFPVYSPSSPSSTNYSRNASGAWPVPLRPHAVEQSHLGALTPPPSRFQSDSPRSSTPTGNPGSPALSNQSLNSPVLPNQSLYSPVLSNQGFQSPALSNQSQTPRSSQGNSDSPWKTQPLSMSPEPRAEEASEVSVSRVNSGKMVDILRKSR